jgi:hypothetical protein
MPSRLIFLLMPVLLFVSGCASAPPNAADQADLAACTRQADAAYNAQNYDALSRTDQTGLRFPATPTQVFQAQQLGLQHQRDSAITDCVSNGTAADSMIPGPPLPTPHIVN